MTAHRLDRRLVIILTVLLLAGCSQATTITAPAPAQSTFLTRLRLLSVQPAILRAAQYRLIAGPDDPESLAAAARSSPESPQDVRDVLAGDVDGVVIVAWLVSFGAMGCWTAYDPRSPEIETVNIPVSTIPDLVANSPGELGIYRLQDHQHLMLVHAVVAGEQAVGAVGFILTQAYDDPVMAAAAKPIG